MEINEKRAIVALVFVLTVSANAFQPTSRPAKTLTYEEGRAKFEAAAKADEEWAKGQLSEGKDADVIKDEVLKRHVGHLRQFASEMGGASSAATDSIKKLELIEHAVDIGTLAEQAAAAFVQRRIEKFSKKQSYLSQDGAKELPTNPVESFNAVTTKIVSILQALKGEDKNLYGNKVKWNYAAAGDAEIDLKKTDSLISPFLGTVEVKLIEHREVEGYGVQEPDVTTFRLTIAAQSEQWVIKKIEIKNKFVPEFATLTNFNQIELFLQGLSQ